MLNKDNEQKVAVVTGGLRGIGNSIALSLLNRGDKVVVFDYVDHNDSSVAWLEEQGLSYIQVDVSSVDSIISGFKKVQDQFSRIDILVNNAGITKDNLAIRLSEEDWDKVLDVNLKGMFFCSQQAIKKMMRQSKSYIVNISSVVGLLGNPCQANYAASKAGVIATTKTLAKEYAARNILVNAIAPGFIETTMTQNLPDSIKEKALSHIALKRFGQVEDIANLILFLTSGSADYITGQVISVDGCMF